MMENMPALKSESIYGFKTMIYDSATGLYNHLAGSGMAVDPLTMVELHNDETYLGTSGLVRAIKRHEDQAIFDRFGIDLIDYLSLPREIISMITEVTVLKREMEARAKQNAQFEVEQTSGGGKIG